MDEIIKIDTIDQYNKLYGLETMHPLVGVVDLTKATIFPNHIRMNMGIYSIFLKQTKCGDLKYGKKLYDYQEGTIVSFAPGQVIGIELKEEARPSSVGIVFHPDLIRGTSLGENIKQYSFFSYEVNEALHVSEEERQIIIDCLDKVRIELSHAIDKHSKTLIAKNIELLLDYCMRFYERQFNTRSKVNKDILVQFENLLDDYFQGKNAESNGYPTVKYFADKVFLSPNYFGDLIKKETGQTAQQYILSKLISLAKDRIINSNRSVSEIAYELGFQYTQHFSRLFKKNVGCSPNEYKKMNV
ncbi:AraC family transcriptional regulator [uncultured Parabacteroides sp.]|uniref:helix-turn-helix domain-containing protein n=1 Tax=uncultured Parabacteroides sp. TaxID=512312 RepID=UPI0025D2C433|nr:response regulator transcription factor [uncultured Parabacteroides sp.]